VNLLPVILLVHTKKATRTPISQKNANHLRRKSPHKRVAESYTVNRIQINLKQRYKCRLLVQQSPTESGVSVSGHASSRTKRSLPSRADEPLKNSILFKLINKTKFDICSTVYHSIELFH